MDDTDKLIDEFVEEEINKPKIDQSDSIDEETVNRQLGEMGWVYDIIQKKLSKDKTCFKCKRDVDFSSEKVNVLQVSKTDKGLVGFVSICEKCSKEMLPKEEEKVKEK